MEVSIVNVTKATVTEIKNDFDRYLNRIIIGNEVIITKNGKEIGRMIPSQTASFLTDSLTGVIKGDYDVEEEKKRIVEKLGGMLHEYADEEKIEGEREAYLEYLIKKYGK